MASIDTLAWLPGGMALTFAMVNVSVARVRHDARGTRMSLYLAFFGLVLILVTTGFGDLPRSGFFVLFCLGFGALLGYLREQTRRKPLAR